LLLAGSGSDAIGLINRGAKRAGKRSAGNPHAAFEVAGAGDGVTDDSKRARRGKPRTQPREVLRATAPVFDPTRSGVKSIFPLCMTQRGDFGSSGSGM